jgi:hypothetical protein
MDSRWPLNVVLVLGLACGDSATTDSSSASTGASSGDPCVCLGGCSEELCPNVNDSSDALACALTALQDRTPGKLFWHTGDQYGEGGDLLIRPDGHAIFTPYKYQDLCTTSGPVVAGPLKAPSYFANCRVAQNFACLESALASTEATCEGEKMDCSGF